MTSRYKIFPNCCESPRMIARDHGSAVRWCSHCGKVEKGARGRALRLREPEDRQSPLNLSIPELVALAAKEPAKFAEICSLSRRDGKTSKARYGVALRRAVREPMLNADPGVVVRGLDMRQRSANVTLDRLHYNLVVKPLGSKQARLGHPGGFWGERLWQVWSLKYAKGFLVVTDTGDQSKVFPTHGELRSSIKASGWEIVK